MFDRRATLPFDCSLILLDLFKVDSKFLENEEKYKEIKAEILGEDSDEDEDSDEESDEGSDEEEGMYIVLALTANLTIYPSRRKGGH